MGPPTGSARSAAARGGDAEPPTAAPASPRAAAVGVAALGVGAVVLVLALLLAGGAPRPAPAGLPDPGPVTGWAVPVARLLQHAGALLALAGSLAALAAPGAPARVRLVVTGAAVWAAASLAALPLTLAEGLGRPVTAVLPRPDLLAQYASEFPRGRVLLLTAVLAVLVAVAAPALRHPAGRVGVPVLALTGLLPAVGTGHAAAGDERLLGVLTLGGHVVAAALWVAGLAALGLLVRAPGALVRAVPRYSAVALACFVVVGVTGVLNAATHGVPVPDLLAGPYGGVLAAKTLALVALGVLGWRHRRVTVPRVVAGRPRAFRALAAGELLLMAAAFGLATALARTPW